MFIKSQDKTELIDITGKRVYTFTNNLGTAHIYADSMFNNISGISEIGEYESKERALEVLDDIANTLKTNASSDEIIGKTRIYREVVFEMPEE